MHGLLKLSFRSPNPCLHADRFEIFTFFTDMTSQEKKFIGILAAASLLGAGGLYFVASNGADRYQSAKEQFDGHTMDINQMQNLPLFPTQQNKQEKEKALAAFKADAQALTSKLLAKRPKSLENINPQAFTNLLVEATQETKKKYAAEGLKIDGDDADLPKGFYLGFENYVSTPAQGSATGILSYQLGAIREVHSILAAAKPSKLLNFYREPLLEEKGETYAPSATVPYRTMPFEVSFLAPESSLRDLINGLQQSSQYFFVIRSMRIVNEKQSAPKASDANFNDAEEVSSAEPAPAAVATFVLPDESEPAAAAPAEAPTEAAASTTDSSRILKQVLGSEELQVFLRVDLVLFDEPQPAAR